MYLKEAFRYQNYLNEKINLVLEQLNSPSLTTRVVQEHMRTKVNPEADNETIDLSLNRSVSYNANQFLAFLEHLIAEKEKLTFAISAAKKNCDIDIDAEIANNRMRQRASFVLTKMGGIRPSERMTRAAAYKFNADGNQVPYQYEVKEVTTIDFDRNNVKRIGKTLIKRADEISTKIDQLMVNLIVDYDAEYNTNDSLEDIMEQFFGE